MEDAVTGSVCDTPGVAGCGVNHCREFLAPSATGGGADFSGRVSDISGGPVAGAKIMLVPKAPEVSEFVTDEEEEESDESISLNLRPGKRRCDYDQGVGLGPVAASADGSGGFDLGLPGVARPELGRVWRRLMGNHYPAMSMIFVSALLDEPGKIELEATAVVPDSPAGS